MTLHLPRLQITQAIVGKDGRPTGQFQRFWQTFAEQIEAAITANAAAIAAAAAANTAAANARTAADDVTAQQVLGTSYVTGLTVSATDAGTDASIEISDHTRVYGDADATTVAVDGGTLTGLAYATSYWVYYDDEGLAGGAVTYAASSTIVGNGSSPGRHLVASVRTPAAGGATEAGIPTVPPGASYP